MVLKKNLFRESDSLGDSDEIFCLFVGLPWISMVTSRKLALLLATIALSPLTPHGIPHSMVRPWGYPMCTTVDQEARSMDSALRLGTLATFVPRKFPLEASLSISAAQ